MTLVVVPNYVRDAINSKLDAAYIETPSAAGDREHHFAVLLDYFNEHGKLPTFSLKMRMP